MILRKCIPIPNKSSILSHCHTHVMMRKCVPHTTYHTFLLRPMIYANVYQTLKTKQKLYSFYSLTFTHMMIYAIAYHTQNITHTVYQDYAVCHTHIRI